MTWRTLSIIDWITSQHSELVISDVAWDEVRIVGWQAMATPLDASTLRLDFTSTPVPNAARGAMTITRLDRPSNEGDEEMIGIVWSPEEAIHGKVQRTQGIERLLIRTNEPMFIAGDDDVLVLGSSAQWLQRHCAIQRAATDQRSLKTAYQVIAGTREAVFGAGPLLIRYTKSPAISAELTATTAELTVGGAHLPSIQTRGRSLAAHSYLEVPIGNDAPIQYAEVALDDVARAKDDIFVALVGNTESYLWHERTLGQIGRSLAKGIEQLSRRTQCKVIAARIVATDGRPTAVAVPRSMRIDPPMWRTSRPWWKFW